MTVDVDVETTSAGSVKTTNESGTGREELYMAIAVDPEGRRRNKVLEFVLFMCSFQLFSDQRLCRPECEYIVRRLQSMPGLLPSPRFDCNLPAIKPREECMRMWKLT